MRVLVLTPGPKGGRHQPPTLSERGSCDAQVPQVHRYHRHRGGRPRRRRRLRVLVLHRHRHGLRLDRRRPSDLTITGDVATALYPGQDAQSFSAKVVNNAENTAYVAGLTAFVTTNKTGCDGSNYSINGSAADSAVALTWVAGDLASGANRTSANTIQFVNKATAQDACKGATLTLNYASN